MWTYDAANNKLRPEDVRLGNLQRQFRSIVVDAADRFAYAGSTSGDVMQVRARGVRQLHAVPSLSAQNCRVASAQLQPPCVPLLMPHGCCACTVHAHD